MRQSIMVMVFVLSFLVGLNVHYGSYGTAAATFCVFLVNLVVMLLLPR